MKTISSKLKITIFVVAIVVIILSVFIGNAITRNNRITTELTAIAESYGLKDIKIIIGSKMKDYDFYEVTVDCSNLESLSYSEMYSLDNSMQVDDAYISKYTSNGNTYEIFPYTKSIYKNGRKIHDDYLNSQSHKDAIKNDKNKTEYSLSVPYNVDSVIVNAEVNNSEANLTGTGTKSLSV